MKTFKFDVTNKTIEQSSEYHLKPGKPQHDKMTKAIRDENQFYRFSDYGIQSSKDDLRVTFKDGTEIKA